MNAVTEMVNSVLYHNNSHMLMPVNLLIAKCKFSYMHGSMATVPYSIGIVGTSCLFVGGGRSERLMKLPQPALPYRFKIGCIRQTSWLFTQSERTCIYMS